MNTVKLNDISGSNDSAALRLDDNKHELQRTFIKYRRQGWPVQTG